MLDYRVQTFMMVCETMNYTKAAERLHITQPGVSQHIHYLEKYYQTKLFEAKNKKLVITEQGSILYRALSTASHDGELLKNYFAKMDQRQSKLNIGATQTIGGYVLNKPIIHYMKLHPETRVNFKIDDTKVLLEDLTKGIIDLAIVEGYYRKQDYDSYLFRQEPFIPVCGVDYLKAEEKVTLESLLEKPLFIREKGSGTRNILENYLAENYLSVSDFRKVIEINNLEVIRGAVKENCGITFLYESVVKRDLDSQKIKTIPLEKFPITHDFTFLWTKNSIHRDWYVELCEELKRIC